MRTVTIQRPVVDLKATGAQIRRTSRRLRKRKLLTFALSRIGIKSQNHCTVYAWDRERRLQAGKGAVPKVWGSPNYFEFTREFKSAKI